MEWILWGTFQVPNSHGVVFFFFFFFVLATLEVAVFVSQEEAGVRSESKCSYKCREGRSPEPPAPRSDSISGFGFGSERLFLSGLHSLSVS